MADDLERAILLMYDAAGDPALCSIAIAYCDEVRRSPPASLLRLCLDRLSTAAAAPVLFWCVQTLHDAIPSFSPAELDVLRSSLLSLASSSSSPLLPSPAFLRNKVAQALAALVRLQYPDPWPDPFLHLLSTAGSHAFDMLLRVLASLDDDLLAVDCPRLPDEAAAAARVKDGIRAQCSLPLARSWYDAAHGTDAGVAAHALDVARRYVPWMDINIVANDQFLPLLFNLTLSPSTPDPIRLAAAGVLLALVYKGMDARMKLALLQSLRFDQVFSQIHILPKLVQLVTGYAVEALECHKKLGGTDNAALELLEDALPSVFYLVHNCHDEADTRNLIDCLSTYVGAMKSELLSQKQSIYIGHILELIHAHIQYDPIHRGNLDAHDKIGEEEEVEMAERRCNYFALLRSVARLAPDATQLFIRNLLVVAVSAGKDVEVVEATLTMFYQLAESINPESLKKGSGLLMEMVPLLISGSFQCHSHRIVALAHLETIIRYMKFVTENDQYIPHMLATFIDNRGMHHPNHLVRQRASYLFTRAVKHMRVKLVPFIGTILQNLQDTIATYTTFCWTSKEIKSSGLEDGTYMFEAIGLLIGMEDVSPEKQSEYLAALLAPLCQQVESLLLDSKVQKIEGSSSKIASLQRSIVAITSVSKGFSERLVTTIRPAIGIMFKQALDVLLQLLFVFPNIEPLRNKITSFLHRMVDILGVSVFPYIPMVLKPLLPDSEPKEMVEFLVLLNQLISKFNSSVEGLLEEIFPTIANRLLHILPKEAFPSGPGYNTEEVREMQELQRTLYLFLHVLATHDLSSVFIAPNSRSYFDFIMHLLLFTSCNHKDAVVRKQCVQIFVKLIKDWCAKYSCEDMVPGFRNFIIETFATKCCLYSVLDKSFEFSDANSFVLFGEIVMAQKVMYEKFGDDFIDHFVSKSLPTAHCPQELVQEYYMKLQGNDVKALGYFYRSLIENLRPQQNGSLVFR